MLRTWVCACSTMVFALGGCGGISIAPSCPNELAVGESAPLLANEVNPGEIPRYLWEVIPTTVARVQDPSAPSTRLEAVSEGEATVRLTASDGLFQVVSSCHTRVSAATEPPDDNTNDNDDNANENDNTTDNGNDNVDDGKDNENDNGGRRKQALP